MEIHVLTFWGRAPRIFVFWGCAPRIYVIFFLQGVVPEEIHVLTFWGRAPRIYVICIYVILTFWLMGLAFGTDDHIVPGGHGRRIDDHIARPIFPVDISLTAFGVAEYCGSGEMYSLRAHLDAVFFFILD